MGYGDYSLQAHRAVTEARAGLSAGAVFSQGQCHPSMNPLGVSKRESRDSEGHPDSVAIVFALDVSGSMGEIPHQLATKTMPTFMEGVTTVLPSPQVMFMAVGNAHSDRSPLQVGQFESEAGLIDKWLSVIHLEGAGGGLGESYDLAMLFAARHTAIDCLEKRQKKGYFFMTGDEPPFSRLTPHHAKQVIGDDIPSAIEIYDMVTELLERYHVFFLIPDAQRAAKEGCESIWRNILHERAVTLSDPEDTAVACALLIGITEGTLPDAASVERQLETRFQRSGESRDRVARAVAPYAEAFRRGPIAPPVRMGERNDPGFQG